MFRVSCCGHGCDIHSIPCLFPARCPKSRVCNSQNVNCFLKLFFIQISYKPYCMFSSLERYSCYINKQFLHHKYRFGGLFSWCLPFTIRLLQFTNSIAQAWSTFSVNLQFTRQDMLKIPFQYSGFQQTFHKYLKNE